MFRIYLGLPVPPRASPRSGKRNPPWNQKYPFRDMDVDAVFYVPLAPGGDDAAKVMSRLDNAVQQFRLHHGRDRRFAIRNLGDRVGVWRVA